MEDKPHCLCARFCASTAALRKRRRHTIISAWFAEVEASVTIGRRSDQPSGTEAIAIMPDMGANDGATSVKRDFTSGSYSF